MNTAITLNQQVLFNFLQDSRGSLPIQDMKELALKAMALVTLYSTQVANNPIETIIEAEQNHQQIFIGDSRNMLSQMPNQVALLDLIRYLSDAQTKGLLTQKNKLDWVQQLLWDDSKTLGGIFFHQSIYALSLALLNKTTAKNIYIPFETRFYHSVMLGENRTIYAEGRLSSSTPAVIDIILGNMNYQTSDAVLSPSYVQNGTLQKFDAGFVAEPWGMKVAYKEFLNNTRFTVDSTNYQNYLIQHAMQQVTGLLIAIVPANTLVSTVASEENMRKWLVNQKHLKSVLSLPSGLLMNTGVNSSMLVFDLSRQFEQINFISLKDSEFIQRKGRDIELRDIEKLANIIWSDETNHNKITVHHQDIMQQNYVLDPERYAIDDVSQKALSILQSYPTQKLVDLVEIIRPIAISKLKEEGEESIYEIQGGDLPEYGYIDIAGKELKVSHTILEQCQSVFLQANDIIMTVRGSVGKVGIVSQNMLDRYQGKVIAGQTNMVLRIKNNHQISSQALLMQLRSDFGQARLRLLSAGAVIAGVSVKDLKDFPIAIFSHEQQKKLEESLENQQIIKQEIEAKKAYMNQLANDIWA